MPTLKFSFLLISLLLVAGCDKISLPTQEAKEDASSLPQTLDNRFIQRSLPYLDNNQNTHFYSLSIPNSYKNQKELPVVIYLHGSGGDENSDLIGFSHFVDNAINECDAEPPLIVFPSDAKRLYVLDNNYHIAQGLLNTIQADFDLAGPEKRVIIGFSNGGAAATRAAIVHPGNFATSYSWAGWVWTKDTYLFKAVVENAAKLQQSYFRAILITGDKDEPQAYDSLISLMKTNNVNYEHSNLKDQHHNLGQYMKRTQERFKVDLCERFKP